MFGRFWLRDISFTKSIGFLEIFWLRNIRSVLLLSSLALRTHGMRSCYISTQLSLFCIVYPFIRPLYIRVKLELHRWFSSGLLECSLSTFIRRNFNESIFCHLLVGLRLSFIIIFRTSIRRYRALSGHPI